MVRVAGSVLGGVASVVTAPIADPAVVGGAVTVGDVATVSGWCTRRGASAGRGVVDHAEGDEPAGRGDEQDHRAATAKRRRPANGPEPPGSTSPSSGQRGIVGG